MESILLSSDDNWAAVEQNLQWSWGKWGKMVKILGRDGVDRRTAGIFYVELVKAVILFGLETWLVIPRLEKAIAGFHHRAVWWMAGIGPEHQWEGTWVYPPIGAALATVGLDEIWVYIYYCQNTVAKYIATRPIMDLCMAAEQRLGIRLSGRWWEQPTLNILGIRAEHAEVERGEEKRMEETEVDRDYDREIRKEG